MNLWILVPIALVYPVARFVSYSKKASPRKDKPIEGRRKIACIGDSITFGHGVVLNRDEQAWTYVMGKMLGNEFQVLNYGISGATALLESKRPFKEHDFIDTATTVEPELYLFMLGTNDSKPENWVAENFPRDYNAMIDRIQKGSPDAKIVLMTPASAFPDPRKKNGKVSYNIDKDRIAQEIVPIVERIAHERELPIIDIHAFTDGHPDWFDDGIHPNEEGNLRMAEHIYEAILPILEERA